MANSLKKTFEGVMGLSSAEGAEDSKHVVTPSLVVPVGLVGALTEDILLWVPDADVTITGLSVVPAGAHTADANTADLTVSHGSLAAGSLTAISTLSDGPTANTFVARTEFPLALGGTTAVAAGTGVWLVVAGSGTPANFTESISILIEYELTN